MGYSITSDEIFSTKTSFVGKIISSYTKKKAPVENQIDGLKSDYAMALDQCQMMKQHIQELESKIEHMNASINLRPETVEPEMPYSTAIVLARRGCDIQEIREACGLTESEANLIVTLHNSGARKQSHNTMLAN